MKRTCILLGMLVIGLFAQAQYVNVWRDGQVVTSVKATAVSITPTDEHEPKIDRIINREYYQFYGQVLELSGSSLDELSVLKLNDVDVPFEVINSFKIRITLPENVSTGFLYYGSDPQEYLKQGPYIHFPQAIVQSVYPMTDVSADDTIFIKGEFVEFIPYVRLEEGYYGSTPIVLTPFFIDSNTAYIIFPDGVSSCEVFVGIADYKTFYAGMLFTRVPIVESISQYEVVEGDTLTISGTYLNLVSTVIINGIEITPIYVDESTIQLIIPEGMRSGDLLLVLHNERVENSGYYISTRKPIYESISQTEISEGDTLTIIGSCLNLVSTVTIKNVVITPTHVDDNTIQIIIPAGICSGMFRLVMSNGEYVLGERLTKVGEVQTGIVLWDGYEEINDWEGVTVLSDGGIELAEHHAEVGDTIRFYLDLTDEMATLIINEGHWNGLWLLQELPAEDWTGTSGTIDLVLTEEMLSMIYEPQWWGGTFIVNGYGWVLTQVNLFPHERVRGGVLWEGNANLANWSESIILLSDGGTELATAFAQAGDTVRFYVDFTAPVGSFEMWEGHWFFSLQSHMVFAADWADNSGFFDLVLTEDLLSILYEKQLWGGTFIVNGDGLTITKISLIPGSYPLLPQANVVHIFPLRNLSAGDVITIIGENLEYLHHVKLYDPNRSDSEMVNVVPTIIDSNTASFIFPANVVDGHIYTSVIGAQYIDKGAYSLRKPIFETVSQFVVEEGDTVTITGLNLDVVSVVSINNELSITPIYVDYATLRIVMPAGISNGLLMLVMSNGESIICREIYVENDVPANGFVLWEGYEEFMQWSNSVLLSDGGTELAQYNAHVGDIVRFYFTLLDETAEISVYEGHWSETWLQQELPAENWTGTSGTIDLVLTEEILSKIYTVNWWGGTFIISGDGAAITQIQIIKANNSIE